MRFARVLDESAAATPWGQGWIDDGLLKAMRGETAAPKVFFARNWIRLPPSPKKCRPAGILLRLSGARLRRPLPRRRGRPPGARPGQGEAVRPDHAQAAAAGCAVGAVAHARRAGGGRRRAADCRTRQRRARRSRRGARCRIDHAAALGAPLLPRRAAAARDLERRRRRLSGHRSCSTCWRCACRTRSTYSAMSPKPGARTKAGRESRFRHTRRHDRQSRGAGAVKALEGLPVLVSENAARHHAQPARRAQFASGGNFPSVPARALLAKNRRGAGQASGHRPGRRPTPMRRARVALRLQCRTLGGARARRSRTDLGKACRQEARFHRRPWRAEPIAPNDSDANRAKNRRVVVVLKAAP